VFRILPNHLIDRLAWDACVEQAQQPLQYGLSWYWDVVCPGWEGAVWLSAEGSYRAVMPLGTRWRWGHRCVEQPLFTQLTGIFHRGDISEQAFFEAFYAQRPWVSRMQFFNTDLHFSPKDIFYKKRKNFLLDLSQSYETIRAGYHSDRRRQVRLAQQQGWSLIESQDIEPMRKLFAANTAHKIKGGVAPRAYQILTQLHQEMHQRGLSTLWYAQKEEKIEAGIWLTHFQQRTVYLFNAASPVGRNGEARTWLLDRYFEQSAGRSNHVFDFESPALPDIMSFYESFGTMPMNFWEIRYNRMVHLRFLKCLKDRILSPFGP
jgi:hypothetical protein